MQYTAIFEAEPGGGYHASCPSLPGCHAEGDTLDEAVANLREAIAVYLSNEVVRELSSAEFPQTVRAPALEMLAGIPQLALTDEVLGVAAVLVRERVMPGPASEGDALHVAASLVHRIDHLITWNQQHLANQRKRTHLQVVCARLGYLLPEIVTPDLMFLGDSP